MKMGELQNARLRQLGSHGAFPHAQRSRGPPHLQTAGQLRGFPPTSWELQGLPRCLQWLGSSQGQESGGLQSSGVSPELEMNGECRATGGSPMAMETGQVRNRELQRISSLHLALGADSQGQFPTPRPLGRLRGYSPPFRGPGEGEPFPPCPRGNSPMPPTPGELLRIPPASAGPWELQRSQAHMATGELRGIPQCPRVVGNRRAFPSAWEEWEAIGPRGLVVACKLRGCFPTS